MDGMNKEKWQAMDKKKKAQYVWDYYKWPILIVIVILIVAVDMIYISITKKDPVMTVAMFNMVPENPNSTDSDFGEFLDTYGYENFDGACSLSCHSGFSVSVTCACPLSVLSLAVKLIWLNERRLCDSCHWAWKLPCP